MFYFDWFYCKKSDFPINYKHKKDEMFKSQQVVENKLDVDDIIKI